MNLLDELKSGVVCGDGAMGTLLLNDGISLDSCLEELCLSRPDRIARIHEQYIAAGARVIETNTFGANTVRLSRFGLEAKVGEINRAAVGLARSAAKGKDVYVAGSIGPLGITSAEAAARGIDRFECFSQQVAAQVGAGVDLIFFETFMDVDEMKVALRAKQALGDVPEICSFACAPDGCLAAGVSLGRAFAELEHFGAKIMGVNCLNDPRQMLLLLQRIAAKIPLAVYPTGGQPRQEGAQLVYDVTPRVFTECAREMTDRGARLIGGCCGTTPDYIAGLAARLAQL